MMSTCKHGLAKTASCKLCAIAKQFDEPTTGGEASHYPTKEAEEGAD